VFQPPRKCFLSDFSQKNLLKAHLAASGTFEAARRAYLTVLVALGALRPLKKSLFGCFGDRWGVGGSLSALMAPNQEEKANQEEIGGEDRRLASKTPMRGWRSKRLKLFFFGDAIWRAFCQTVSTPLLVGRAQDTLTGRLSREAPLKGRPPSTAAIPQLRVCWASESRVKKLASVCAEIASVCAG
jgi:hypothetical protein